MNKKFLIFIRRILLPLVLGVLIYSLFRPPLFWVYGIFGWESEIISLSAFPLVLSEFILYHLTDVLWALSFVETIYFISKNKYLAVTIVAIFTILFESGQYFDCIRGTGDICDILCVFVMLAIYLKIITILEDRKSEEIS